jgi:hypothetical protein
MLIPFVLVSIDNLQTGSFIPNIYFFFTVTSIDTAHSYTFAVWTVSFPAGDAA